MPKKATSAYMYFVMSKLPDLKEEGIAGSAAMTKCGQLWGALSDKDKKVFEDKNKKDVERHAKQLKEIEEKGYFKMEDGSKSSDHDPKVKKVKGAESKIGWLTLNRRSQGEGPCSSQEGQEWLHVLQYGEDT